MKKALLVLAVCFLASFSAEAQRTDRPKREFNPEKWAERITNRMTEELSLTEEQQKEVYALHLERMTDRAEAMKAQMERMKAEQKETREKLEAILTPEQKAKWEESRSEWREKRSRHWDGEKKREKRKKRDYSNKGS